MNVLPFLVGSTAEEPLITYREPYHMVWNPSTMRLNESTYIIQSYYDPEYEVELLNTTVLTDHAPPIHNPSLLSWAPFPFDTSAGFTRFAVELTHPIGPMFRLRHLREVADPDRRGKLPKVFQFRIATDLPGVYDVMRIKMNAANTKYIKLCLRHLAGDAREVFLSMCLDGVNVVESAAFEYEADTLGMSQSLRLAILTNKVNIYYDDPGTQVATLPVTEPLICDSTAEFQILDVVDPSGTVRSFFFDTLLIYDAFL